MLFDDTVYVYISFLPDELNFGRLFPQKRNEEIFACNNSKLKAQKHFSWEMLSFALKHSLQQNICDMNIVKNDNGKWICNDCCFSITHSDSAVAVAVAKYNVGIDIEYAQNKKFNASFYKKIATEEEYLFFGSQPDSLTISKLWTAKESIFKCMDKKLFRPNTISAQNKNCLTLLIDSTLTLSIFAHNPNNIKLFSLTKVNDFDAKALTEETFKKI